MKRNLLAALTLTLFTGTGMAYANSSFDQIDTNKDGSISRAEFDAHMKAHCKMHHGKAHHRMSGDKMHEDKTSSDKMSGDKMHEDTTSSDTMHDKTQGEE